MPSFCRLKLPLRTYIWPYIDTKLLNVIYSKPSFIMLYTGDFVLCYYVRFSQIRSNLLFSSIITRTSILFQGFRYLRPDLRKTTLYCHI